MRSRARSLALLVAIFGVSGMGCSSVQGPFTLPIHEHDNFCGHAYRNDVHLNPTPGDFAGAGAPWGPTWENEIRIRDPFRNGKPVPERSVPWTVPGGNPSDRVGPPPYPLEQPPGERGSPGDE